MALHYFLGFIIAKLVKELLHWESCKAMMINTKLVPSQAHPDRMGGSEEEEINLVKQHGVPPLPLAPPHTTEVKPRLFG